MTGHEQAQQDAHSQGAQEGQNGAQEGVGTRVRSVVRPRTDAAVIALCDRLEQLRAEATAGEWTADSHEIYQAMPGLPEHVNAGEWIGETCRIEGDPLYGTSAADAALIVAAVNALPDLIAELRRQAAALRAVEALAEEYDRNGYHQRARKILTALAAAAGQ